MSRGPAVIITEKDNAARRIADILSDGTADTERVAGTTVYKWGGKRCIGLSGHVVGVDFPPEYNDWRDVEPVELIDAPIDKQPTQEGIVRALRQLARRASHVTIATDYDREGELIGKEAYELVREVNEDVQIDRVRFSSITDREVTEAFDNPDELDFELAAAGEARQVIDLLWGAALTRFLSLSARQLGDDFISVGRVQGPTLKLIVDREREIEAFDPEDYWELFADLETDADGGFEAQYFYRDEDGNEAERLWDGDRAEAVYEALADAETAAVDSVNRRTRTDSPPAPFNTTQFIRAAGSLNYSAQQAMSIAEELYTAGYLTYPRTDNTVYPEDLDPRELLESFTADNTFGDDAESLLAADDITPTEGDEETTDHPPIHPTGELPSRSELSEDEWEIYELVVRRFFATVADDATWEHLKVVAEIADREVVVDGESTAEDLTLKANGKRLVEAGYHAVYPYFSQSETHVPDVTAGDELAITDTQIEAKQTQPPRRYGQSRLIETMEDLGIGTKCLTEDTEVLHRNEEGDIERVEIQQLFDESEVLLADGDTDIATTTDGPATLSYDETTDTVTEREQTLISERPLEDDEQVYEITTRSGSFSVTGEHPVYVRDETGALTITRADKLQPGDRLLSTRRAISAEAVGEGCAVSWETFVGNCDSDSKLYGVDCNEQFETARKAIADSQGAFAERVGAHRPAITRYENDDKDVPLWLLDAVDIRPEQLHGLNYDQAIDNPFPLYWSPALARLIANAKGDGSVFVSDEENTVDIRYHNTDKRLIDRFVSDIETLFGVEPRVSTRAGREAGHAQRYQVQLSAATGRVLLTIIEAITDSGLESIPEPLQPIYVGALFDDEGHIDRDRKAFISNTDHQLLEQVGSILETHDIDTRLSRGQHKLYVRGRRNLERFLDIVPVSADKKFYRGLAGLRQYDTTVRKAEVLAEISQTSLTTFELADRLDVSVQQIRKSIQELREDGYVEKHIEGSNRSHDGNRTFRYTTDSYSDSIYATIMGEPATTPVTDISERAYDGPVYDLTIDEQAPNFAVEGGVVVHNSTRHHTIEKLYDRGYLENDPPRPTMLAKAVVEAAEEFADQVVSEEMTAQLEADMEAIAAGEKGYDEVTAESRRLLESVFDDLTDSREEIGSQIQKSLKADKTLGPCPECDDDLLIRTSRQGSYFIGCDGYPDCEYTLPLPSTGKPLLLDETCEEHDLREVKLLAGRKTFVHGCPQCQADAADAEDDRVIGTCPDCGEEHDGELAIKQLRNGSRLVGCTRYPDCEYSLPLPRRGDIEITDGRCEEHDLPELVVTYDDDDREPWELGCPICNYREYQARQNGSALEAIDGIGEKTAEKLQTAGIEDVAGLKDANPDELAEEVDGVGADTVRDWQADAD
ncbi:DNA topoisomerase I [Halonotius sp. F2-221B]